MDENKDAEKISPEEEELKEEEQEIEIVHNEQRKALNDEEIENLIVPLYNVEFTGEIAGSVQLLLCSRPGSLPFTVVISSHGGRHPFHRAG